MSRRVALGIVYAVIAIARLANAQSTTGTISGRVVDPQDRALPGVMVTVESPNLQGVRGAVTSETGDYILPSLPPGPYEMTFELSGFERQQRRVGLAPTQVLPVDAKLGIASIAESLTVTGSANVLVQTAQVATNFSQDLISTLPTTRDINAALLMAPSVHATGPNGFYSIAGSMSYENLFLVNGVTVNENLRGQAHDLYIEDAIQETTIAAAGVSAEYGRFSGGVVNVITKSGGNLFSGSLRDTLNNDNWRGLTPFAGDSKVDKLLPTVEYTLGGPVMKDRLWFFTAGRGQSVSERRTLAVTNAPYDFSNQLRRYEAKATYAVRTGHRIEGAYTRSTEAQTNATFNPTTSMDERSLYDANRLMDLATVSYSAALSPNFLVEARFSARNETLKNVGAPTTDLIDGTLLVDQSRNGRRYWSPTFCGVCDPEERDNRDVFVKGSYFLSKPGAGSHNLVFGYDGFNDHRFANNHQSGSDYRILGTSAIITGSELTPVFLGNGTTLIQWNPIFVGSEGADFRVHSGFFNDSWRVSSNVTANLGLRYDRNEGTNSAGAAVSRDSAWSPRAGIVWDPYGTQEWSVTASVARYVAGLSTGIANASSAGGNSDTYQYVYRGPSVNGNGVVETATPAAIRQVFDWFSANGGSNLPLTGTPNIPGVTPQIRGSLTSPNVYEYASGLSRNWGSRAAVRADFIFRDYRDFYVTRTDMSTGKVTDKLGRTFDLGLIENADHLKRRYAGLSTQATYRVASTLDLGATYTLSEAWGNVDGETAGAGPTADASLQYPEYKQASWNYPEGDLAIDQRHRARIWANYALPWVPRLTLSALQTFESGAPYGAVSASGVNAQPYVTNPGYVTPLPPNQTVYYFTPRDAYRLEGQVRTDFAATYSHNLPGIRKLQLFGQLQVINLFNQFQLCGCGSSVTQSGGAVNAGRIDQTVRTSVTTPADYQTFNPFTTMAVQGVNWDPAPTFGTALNRMAYTSPRALRLSFGVRF
jgi:outer membrane receptor for ferrienterochelin and colicin